MRHNTMTKRVGWALVVLAAAQLVVLFHRQMPGLAAGGRWLEAGDGLASLGTADALGHASPLPTGRPTVLLVFDPLCGHCREVAPLWAEWVRTSASRFRILAVAEGPPGPALAFARDQGWEVELLTVPEGRRGGVGQTLTRRTPWVFLLDEAGVIVAEGHGQRVAELTRGPGGPAGGSR